MKGLTSVERSDTKKLRLRVLLQREETSTKCKLGRITRPRAGQTLAKLGLSTKGKSTKNQSDERSRSFTENE